MQRCSDRGDCGDVRYEQGQRCRCRLRHRRSVSVKRAGLHVMGLWIRSLGASFAPADWQMRVFWLSGIVDIPSDHLYVRTIHMSGCIDRRSRYTTGGYNYPSPGFHSMLWIFKLFHLFSIHVIKMSFFTTSRIHWFAFVSLPLQVFKAFNYEVTNLSAVCALQRQIFITTRVVINMMVLSILITLEIIK